MKLSGEQGGWHHGLISLVVACLSLCTMLPLFANADSATVLSLFDSSSLVPGFLLPFKLQGTLIDQGIIQNVTVTTDNGADCRVMADPFLPKMFLLKCATESNATLNFQVLSGGSISIIHYGPVAIALPANVTQIGSTSSGGGPSLASQGQALFSKYGCIACHSGTMPVGASPTAILNAINSVSSMNHLQGLVSDSDRTLLSAYLNSL